MGRTITKFADLLIICHWLHNIFKIIHMSIIYRLLSISRFLFIFRFFVYQSFLFTYCLLSICHFLSIVFNICRFSLLVVITSVTPNSSKERNYGRLLVYHTWHGFDPYNLLWIVLNISGTHGGMNYGSGWRICKTIYMCKFCSCNSASQTGMRAYIVQCTLVTALWYVHVQIESVYKNYMLVTNYRTSLHGLNICYCKVLKLLIIY